MVKDCPTGRFAEINVPFPTVGSIICKFKQHGTTINWTQSGANNYLEMTFNLDDNNNTILMIITMTTSNKLRS